MSKAGHSIIMIGNAASHRALSILEERRAELISRYPERYLLRGEELLKQDIEKIKEAAQYIETESFRRLIVKTVNKKADNSSKSGMKEQDIPLVIICDKSGIFGGLWKLGELLEGGLCVEQADIPVLQIAIELCDLADESLFEVDSEGTILAIVENGRQVIEELGSKGIEAKEIGYTTANNDRVIRNGELTRFINKVR